MDSTACTKDLSDLVLLVRSKLGLDLTKYRPQTIRRRVSHRMSVLGVENLNDYMMHLTNTPNEINHLLETVTVHVTGFFRDRDVFDTLFKEIFRDLLEEKLSQGHKIVRVWSAGCSTGEEAYSIAIMLLKLVNDNKFSIKVEVFGTDISEESCRTARAGIYPAQRIEDVPVTLRRRFFTAEGAEYKVAPVLRRCVKFMTHDLFSEPPYSMLDLVVCRNVLIHFENTARHHVMKNFHSSLNNRGLILLGKSEALAGSNRDLFELVDPRNKIYRKRMSKPL